MVLTVSCALSPGIGCLAPVTGEFVIRLLGISTGMPEPRDFTVASGSFVRMALSIEHDLIGKPLRTFPDHAPMRAPDTPTASRTRRP
jgi:hypothetical protein